MIGRFESSFPRADPLRVATAAAFGVAVLAASWVLLHVGFYDDAAIVDTPVYQGYGDAMVDGRVPYRDFALEYPPGALPVFLLPSFGAAGDYEALFEILMLGCGAFAVVFVALALGGARASAQAVWAGVALAAVSPLLLGTVVLSRYDLWPAALSAGALAALVAGRPRIGLAALGAAVAAKVYPGVLVPLALAYVARRHGRRDALVSLGAFGLVVAVAFVPFAVVAPDGLVDAFERQAGRPLQIESLGAGVLLAAHRLGVYEARVESSHGSQNLAGPLPDALAGAQTVLQVLAILGVWALFARSRRDEPALLVASAAAVGAFAAFGKVLSPQFLVWLLPLVPLAAGVVGALPAALFAATLVLTQLWFPFRYWDVVALEPVAWLVVVRNAVLVALVGALALAIRRTREAPDSP